MSNPILKPSRAVWATLLCLITACVEPGPDGNRSWVLPAIESFLSANPQYGSVREIVDMPAWAKGPRQQVNLTSGRYLFYVQDGQVVTVYKYEGEGRSEVYRKDIPDPPKDIGARPAEDNLPAYDVLDIVDQRVGGRYGEILITAFSRQTPPMDRETMLRAIMAKENLSRADLYCSEAAKKANSSSSYAASNPQALRTCYLGGIQDGAFTPGEALF